MRQPFALKTERSSGASRLDAADDVGPYPISHPCPTNLPDDAGPATLSVSHWLATASCMDLRQQSRHDLYRARLHHYNTASHPSHPLPKQARPASYTGPLAPNQWDTVPLPYRPREWQDPKDEPLPLTKHEPHRWRLRPSMNDSAQKPSESRARRRPRAFRTLTSRDRLETQSQPQDADPTFLYPQTSPYDDAQSSYSAPDELLSAPRAVSQPNTPANWPTPYQVEEAGDAPPFAMLPRTPTYPPSHRRRARGTASNTEATFTDDEEFHLFVQATAGLGPEQAFRSMNSPDESPRRSRTTGSRPFSFSTPQIPAPPDLVSPLQETPTTLYALQQHAQLPHDPRIPAPPRPLSGQSFGTQRLDTALGGIDVWLEPPSAVAEDDDGVTPVDDELPDYAASQAQALAAQRAEATRRAQELQRRWQLRTG